MKINTEKTWREAYGEPADQGSVDKLIEELDEDVSYLDEQRGYHRVEVGSDAGEIKLNRSLEALGIMYEGFSKEGDRIFSVYQK